MACSLSHDSQCLCPCCADGRSYPRVGAESPAANQHHRSKTDCPQAEDTEITVAPGGEFPIVNQKITLTVLIMPESNITDYINNEFTKWLEEKTNIHLDITLAPQDQTEADQKLNAIFASGDLPDIIIGWGNMTLDRQLALARAGVDRPDQ